MFEKLFGFFSFDKPKEAYEQQIKWEISLGEIKSKEDLVKICEKKIADPRQYEEAIKWSEDAYLALRKNMEFDLSGNQTPYRGNHSFRIKE